MVGGLDSGSLVPRFESCWRQIQLMTARHFVAQSLSLPLLSRHDLNNVERGLKHQTIIINKW